MQLIHSLSNSFATKYQYVYQLMYMEVIACRISVVLGTQCSSWLQVDPKRA